MSGFFHVSARDHAALILMTALARAYADASFQSLQAIAQEMQLSSGYLEEISAALKSAGLIVGKQGPGGGYRLARAPQDISIADIVTAMEGPIELVDCQSSSSVCPVEGKCVSKNVWHKLQTTLRDSLRNMSLAETLQ